MLQKCYKCYRQRGLGETLRWAEASRARRAREEHTPGQIHVDSLLPLPRAHPLPHSAPPSRTPRRIPSRCLILSLPPGGGCQWYGPSRV